jgi:hypothetical protein
LADTLSRLFWPYNTLVESGDKRLIKDHVDKKNLIKDIDTKVERKRKYAVDNVVEEKKKRKLHVVNKGKDKLKEAHDKLISCDTSVISGSPKVIIPRETSDLFNNAKLTAYTNKLRNKNEEFLFCVSHLDVYETPASDEEKKIY